ncbi:hypothetical protein GUJ93_ZPchr0002g25872 [Zizania palustris]|uniref:CWF21 domain-containing protein n=1 Tax=Zizania palustris TaxID=103762 RepID=A0A8J5VAX3_ZIZPA|nr:hypothetical protein GUJ93_ZPchr0002g25872 [Zizania palustris]
MLARGQAFRKFPKSQHGIRARFSGDLLRPPPAEPIGGVQAACSQAEAHGRPRTRTPGMVKPRSPSGGELGDGLGALGDGVLGELSRDDKAAEKEPQSGRKRGRRKKGEAEKVSPAAADAKEEEPGSGDRGRSGCGRGGGRPRQVELRLLLLRDALEEQEYTEGEVEEARKVNGPRPLQAQEKSSVAIWCCCVRL